MAISPTHNTDSRDGQAKVTSPAPSLACKTGVRRLLPETTKIFKGTYGLLHCHVKDDTLYRGVFAVLLFPISNPKGYVSLRYTDEDDKIREIGVIENLEAFPSDAQELIQATLAKQYYEQFISHIYDVKYEFGLLFFDVETQQGRLQFMMPWRHDRAEDYGTQGKVLLDVSDNRFIIPNLLELPLKDRRKFTSYIYW